MQALCDSLEAAGISATTYLASLDSMKQVGCTCSCTCVTLCRVHADGRVARTAHQTAQ